MLRDSLAGGPPPANVNPQSFGGIPGQPGSPSGPSPGPRKMPFPDLVSKQAGQLGGYLSETPLGKFLASLGTKSAQAAPSPNPGKPLQNTPLNPDKAAFMRAPLGGNPNPLDASQPSTRMMPTASISPRGTPPEAGSPGSGPPMPQNSGVDTMRKSLGGPSLNQPALAQPTLAGWDATVTPTPEAKKEPSITGADVQKFVRSAMAGAAGANPRSPGLSALAQGASGAMTQRYGEDQGEAAAKLKAAEKAFDQDMAKRKDARADRGEARASRGESRADRKDAREAALAPYRKAKLIADVMKTVNPKVTLADRVNVEKALTNHANMLITANGGIAPDDLMAQVEAKKKQILGGDASGPYKNATSGTGKSKLSPKTFSGSEAEQKKQFDALGKEEWFINPADGKLMQK